MRTVTRTTWTTAPIYPTPTRLTMTRMERVTPVTMTMTTMAFLMTKTTVGWLSTLIRQILMVRQSLTATPTLFSKSAGIRMWILELFVHFFSPYSAFRWRSWWYLQRWLWSRQRSGHRWCVPWEFCHQWNWFPQIPNGAFRPNRHLADRPQLGGEASGQRVGPDCQLWSWHRCRYVRKGSIRDPKEVSQQAITIIFCYLRQVMMSSAPWISAGPSSSTRTETMTTLDSCLVTSQAHVSTRWCGNRSHRRTGLPHPRELKVTLASQSKLSIPPPVLASTWGMPCGTRETPQDRRVHFLAPYWEIRQFYSLISPKEIHLISSGADSVARPQEHWLEGLHSLQMASDPQTQNWTN